MKNLLCTPARRGAAIGAALCLGLAGAPAQQKPAAAEASSPTAHPERAAASLDELRLTMGKWIETQQIIAKERKDWQQGKEVLQGRLELVKKEIAALEEKIDKAQSGVAEATKKRDELVAANEALVEQQARLTKVVAQLENSLRKLMPSLPEPVLAKVQPTAQQMPTEGAPVRVVVAERFRNVLLMLGEIDKANSDLSVAFEVRTLPNGKKCEVQSLYLGLGQAYYVSAEGDAGIGKPGVDGWYWEVAPALARDLVVAFEILQGKHSPAFVNLPVLIQ